MIPSPYIHTILSNAAGDRPIDAEVVGAVLYACRVDDDADLRDEVLDYASAAGIGLLPALAWAADFEAAACDGAEL